MNNKNTFKIAAWISTSAAVIAGIYFTKDPLCLWALLIPIWI